MMMLNDLAAAAVSDESIENDTMVITPPGGSRGGGRGGGRGEEEDEVSVGDKEVDVIGMERKQMIVDVLVLPCRCC